MNQPGQWEPPPAESDPYGRAAGAGGGGGGGGGGGEYASPAYGPPPGYGPGAPAPGYGAPGPYGPQWEYGQAGLPRTDGDETTWAIAAYIGTIILGFIAPLVVYLAKKDDSPLVRFHAAQSLNYLITVMAEMIASALIAVAVAVLLRDPVWLLLAAPVWAFHFIAQWVFLILGAVRSSRREFYRFPTFTCWPMIR